jgi:hypothetical protein
MPIKLFRPRNGSRVERAPPTLRQSVLREKGWCTSQSAFWGTSWRDLRTEMTSANKSRASEAEVGVSS